MSVDSGSKLFVPGICFRWSLLAHGPLKGALPCPTPSDDIPALQGTKLRGEIPLLVRFLYIPSKKKWNVLYWIVEPLISDPFRCDVESERATATFLVTHTQIFAGEIRINCISGEETHLLFVLSCIKWYTKPFWTPRVIMSKTVSLTHHSTTYSLWDQNVLCMT